MTSRAGDSEASTQPISNSSVASSRPRHSGRKPFGSRTPINRSASSRTNEKAPSTEGSTEPGRPPGRRRTSDAGALGVDSGGYFWARSSATRSLSEETMPGSIPACSASDAVLVRFPLWASPNPARPTPRNAGWALIQSLDPAVEYRVWPMARCPRRPESLRSSNTVVTRPMSFITVMASPSLTAMPADSWPRCWSANSPSKARCATDRPGAYTPKTPHASLASIIGWSPHTPGSSDSSFVTI